MREEGEIQWEEGGECEEFLLAAADKGKQWNGMIRKGISLRIFIWEDRVKH